MSAIHFHQTTTLTPEEYVAGLTDFGPGRSKLFGNSADEYLKLHQHGRIEADVTEGSGGVWERLHYDWSDPNHVVLTTTDSNRVGWRFRPHVHFHSPFQRHRRTLTLTSYARARTSRDVCSASCSEQSAKCTGKGVRKQRQGHRSPERRGERATRCMKRR